MSSQLIYLTTCYRGIKDTLTGFFSFMDLFDTIFIPKDTDFIWLSFCIGGKLYSDILGDIKVEVTFIYPDHTVSSPIIVTGTVLKGDVHFVAIFPLTKFTQLGKYKLKASLNGEELKSTNEFYFTVVKLA